MDIITLSGKRDLDIYVNPQRQRLLRLMTIIGRPVTPKELSDRMGISASSVQYHLKKLAGLGLVRLSHTERIRGITARFYIAPPVTVTLGCLSQDGNNPQRVALMQSSVNGVFNGFLRYFSRVVETPALAEPLGDVMWGVVHLGEAEARELSALVRRFLQEHEAAGEGCSPWEYALIAYPATEADDA